MPIIRPKQDVGHIAKEVFRVHRYIYQKHVIVGRRGKLKGKPQYYDGHYLNRAYTIEGQWYERITLCAPSYATLENSITKWGQSKGKITKPLTETWLELLDQGWILTEPRYIQKKQSRTWKSDTELKEHSEEDLIAAIKRQQEWEKRQEYLKKKKFITSDQLFDKVNEPSSYVSEELQRALDFQKREKEKLEARKGKKK